MSGAIPITGPQTDRARIAPVPDWVVHAPYDSPAVPEEIFVAGGRCMLLDDTQVDLVGPVRSWHGRYVERVMTNSGAERAAQFSVPFDPICETVEIHFVRVHRGDKVIEHAKPEAFEVFRRERSLERLVFDGRLTVHLVIPDVRPGDVVETSYTIIGGNPILRGKHAAWIAFEWGQAMMETRHRLRTRTDRPIHFRGVNGAPAPEVIEHDGIVDRRWRAVRRPAVETEDLAPPWEISRAEIQFSEFDSWDEVAALFTPLYETDDALPADLQEAVDIIAQGSVSQADRAAEVLRFVQRSLRYLSLSIAEGGLQPRAIETAWTSRYGDCKDAARLYTAIARRVGLDACPALVNTRQGEGLNEWLPTASAFDHCIVRVIVDGRTHWLDPTRRNQEGGLAHIYKAYYGWALPLAPGVDSLSFMGPVRPDHTVDVKERVVFGPKPSSPATYEWRTTYSSWRADDLRERIANEGLGAVAKTYLRQLQDVWPGLVALEPMRFEDAPEENKLTTIERYEIPAPWKRVEGGRVEFATKDYFISADLSDLPANGSRKRDVHLGRPRESTRTVELELPVNWPSEGWNVAVEAPGALYETALQRDRKKKRLFTLTQRLRVERDTMPAADATRYVELVAAMRKGSDVVITSATAGDTFAQAGPRANWLDALRLIFIVAVVLAAVVRFLGSN